MARCKSTAVVMTAIFMVIGGAAASCNTQEAQQVVTEGLSECLCINTTLRYNYRDNTCEESPPFCGLHGEEVDGTCVCMSGWTLQGEQCVDVDECADSATCSTTSEDCNNNNGSYYCSCQDKYYRSSGTTCSPLDESTNPRWNDCPQLALDESTTSPAGFSCACYHRTAYTDVDGDGRNCVLSEDYEPCPSESGEVVCVQRKDGSGDPLYFAVQGYALNADNTARDMDECSGTEVKDAQCWYRSTCVNKEGYYACECDDGYVKMNGDPDSVLVTECVAAPCRVEEATACHDPCQTVTPSPSEVCTLTGPYSAEARQMLNASVLAAPADEALLMFQLTVENKPLPAGYVARALEVVLGGGVVEATTEDEEVFNVKVVTGSERLRGRTAAQVQQLLEEECQLSNFTAEYCGLPEGIVVMTGSIEVVAADPCTASSACSSSHTCSPTDTEGRYNCSCADGGTGEWVTFVEVCDLAEELRKELDDSKHTNVVLGSVLGSLLGVSLVAVAVLGVLYGKTRCT